MTERYAEIDPKQIAQTVRQAEPKVQNIVTNTLLILMARFKSPGTEFPDILRDEIEGLTPHIRTQVLEPICQLAQCQDLEALAAIYDGILIPSTQR